MVSLRIGLEFAILALGPGILPGLRPNGIMLKAFKAFISFSLIGSG